LRYILHTTNDSDTICVYVYCLSIHFCANHRYVHGNSLPLTSFFLTRHLFAIARPIISEIRWRAIYRWVWPFCFNEHVASRRRAVRSRRLMLPRFWTWPMETRWPSLTSRLVLTPPLNYRCGCSDWWSWFKLRATMPYFDTT